MPPDGKSPRYVPPRGDDPKRVFDDLDPLIVGRLAMTRIRQGGVGGVTTNTIITCGGAGANGDRRPSIGEDQVVAHGRVVEPSPHADPGAASVVNNIGV